MKKIKTIIIAALLLGAYQSHAQQKETGVKKRRMFFYPDKPEAATLISENLLLFPNPAGQEVEITIPELSASASLDGFTLLVFDQKGVKLMERGWDKGKLDVSGFVSGNYIVSLRKDRQLYSQKLVVIR